MWYNGKFLVINVAAQDTNPSEPFNPLAELGENSAGYTQIVY